MNEQDFLKQILTDVKVKISEEFDKNFQRKAFFDKNWSNTKHPNNRGSLMLRSGNLRRSLLNPRVQNMAITWSSSMPYAALHNEGGTITVTAKMKKFFWAMFYKNNGAIMMKRNGSGEVVERNTARNRHFIGEAAKWRAMALMKIGTKIKIEERQFIGHHHQIDQMVQTIIDRNFTQLDQYIRNNL